MTIKTKEEIRHRSALRSHPLPQERIVAQRAILSGVELQVIEGVSDDGVLQYAKENELVKLFNTMPFRQRRSRPNTQFGPR